MIKYGLLLILFFQISCQPLNFNANSSPIEQLKDIVFMEESIEIAEFVKFFYFNEGDKINLKEEFPLVNLFPIDPITHYTGYKYGNDREKILFDYSECITQQTCNIHYNISYSSGFYLKSRTIFMTIERNNTNIGSDDKIILLNDKQIFSDGKIKNISLANTDNKEIIINNEIIYPDYYPIISSSIMAKYGYPDKVTMLSNLSYLEKQEETGDLNKIKIIYDFINNRKIYTIDNNWSMEVTPATYLSFRKKENNFNFTINKTFSFNTIKGIFSNNSFNFNIIYPDNSIITNRSFYGKITGETVYWKDLIKFNDSTSQTIEGRWGTYSIKITTDELFGWLNVYNGNRKRKIAGSLFSYRGELSITSIETFYLYKKFTYQWDSYYSPKTSPDEIADFTFYSYINGFGTIIIFDGDLQKSKSISTDFWNGTIE